MPCIISTYIFAKPIKREDCRHVPIYSFTFCKHYQRLYTLYLTLIGYLGATVDYIDQIDQAQQPPPDFFFDCPASLLPGLVTLDVLPCSAKEALNVFPGLIPIFSVRRS